MRCLLQRQRSRGMTAGALGGGGQGKQTARRAVAAIKSLPAPWSITARPRAWTVTEEGQGQSRHSGRPQRYRPGYDHLNSEVIRWNSTAVIQTRSGSQPGRAIEPASRHAVMSWLKVRE